MDHEYTLTITMPEPPDPATTPYRLLLRLYWEFHFGLKPHFHYYLPHHPLPGLQDLLLRSMFHLTLLLRSKPMFQRWHKLILFHQIHLADLLHYLPRLQLLRLPPLPNSSMLHLHYFPVQGFHFLEQH